MHLFHHVLQYIDTTEITVTLLMNGGRWRISGKHRCRTKSNLPEDKGYRRPIFNHYKVSVHQNNYSISIFSVFLFVIVLDFDYSFKILK